MLYINYNNVSRETLVDLLRRSKILRFAQNDNSLNNKHNPGSFTTLSRYISIYLCNSIQSKEDMVIIIQYKYIKEHNGIFFGRWCASLLNEHKRKQCVSLVTWAAHLRAEKRPEKYPLCSITYNIYTSLVPLRRTW